MENKDKSAFPLDHESNSRINEGFGVPESGLTKREYFAGLAMQGLLSNSGWMASFDGDSYLMNKATVAEVSISMADELLKALEK